MELDNTFWAFISFVVFIGVLVYMKVPQALTKMLDGRIAKIQTDLDEAKKLREEAQALLAEYERKRKAAESEAEDIITAARDEADRLAEEAKVSIEDMVARRTRSVEDKIAQAEAQAVAEVRARSADVAVEAARILLTDQVKKSGDAMVEDAIKEVGSRLN